MTNKQLAKEIMDFYSERIPEEISGRNPLKEMSSLVESEKRKAVEEFVDFLKRKDEGATGVSFRTNWTIHGIKSEMFKFLEDTK
jgi:hypothetical protein